jgi:hypothetical protein
MEKKKSRPGRRLFKGGVMVLVGMGMGYNAWVNLNFT